MLTHIASRVEKELTEERAGLVSATADEPYFDLIHGIPGAGKSRVIAWICELFTDILSWCNQNQFVCLAVQNTMAASIGGSTIHHWGNIPFRDEKGNASGKTNGGKRDTSILFNRCLNLRWILIDEISMVSAELLYELQYLVRQAVRRQGTYKVRSDRSIRPFGGVNVLLFGDFWQLRPVRATPLFEPPKKAKTDVAYEGAMLLWGQNRNSVQRLWELKQPMRCLDPWYLDFLHQCRHGMLDKEDYFFIHGVPTDNAGTWIRNAGMPACGKKQCANLRMIVEKMFKSADPKDLHRMLEKEIEEYKQKRNMKAEDTLTLPEAVLISMLIKKEECSECNKERTARAAVAMKKDDDRFKRLPFSTAPYIHQLNDPKHAANLQRSVIWAETHERSINWVTAHDFPLHRDDQVPPVFFVLT